MAERDPEVLSEQEAARLWERAAQLQAEAAGKVEPPAVHDESTPSSGYALAHVRSAALEAGIGTEFVDAALADLRVGRAHPPAEKSTSLARRFLNHPPDTITARRVIEATPQEVLSVMEAVFPAEPFRLTLTDQQGDPLDGGVLVFDIQGTTTLLLQGGFAFETREAGLRQVFVSLRSIEGSKSSRHGPRRGCGGLRHRCAGTGRRDWTLRRGCWCSSRRRPRLEGISGLVPLRSAPRRKGTRRTSRCRGRSG